MRTAAAAAHVSAPRDEPDRRHGSLARDPGIVWLAASAAIVLLAAALRTVWPTNGDVSWLLYVAERTLQGDVPYRDILESNPPASILIYMPAVALARLLGTSPEAATDVLVFLAAATSLALVGAIIRPLGLFDRARAAASLCAGCVILLLLPLNSFAQREQIAVLALLPCLAALAARASARPPRFAHAVMAGLGAGLVLAIKPAFGLALVGPALIVLSARPWREVVRAPEPWIAGGVSVGYVLLVTFLFPAYAERVLPLVAHIYIPARLPILDLLAAPTVSVWLLLVAAFWAIRRRGDVFAHVAVLASVGFEGAFFLQGKGFDYHGYPAIALAALGCVLAAMRDDGASARTRARRCFPFAACLALATVTFTQWSEIDRDAPGLTAAIAGVAPRPRLLSIGGDMTYGRVFARENGAEWVGSTPIAWITLYAYALTPNADHDPRFAEAIRDERIFYARDIESRRPDAVLIEDSGWSRWCGHSPALMRALSRYERVGTFGAVILLKRVGEPETTLHDRAEGPRVAARSGDPHPDAQGSTR